MTFYKLFACLFIINIWVSCNSSNGWIYLLQKNDLSEFKQVNGTADYILEDGVLIGITKHDTPNSFLATQKSYSDFILEFEVKIEDGMNSGVQFRSALHEDTGRVFGYQVEIETSDRRWAGGIYDEGRRGWLYPLTNNEKGQFAFKRGAWNKYRVEAIGNSIRTWLNGIQCANLVDDVTSEGFVAFQVHSIGEAEEAGKKVRWRNMRIMTDGLDKERWEVDESVERINLVGG